MSSGERRYGDDNSHINQNKGKGCTKKMRTQLEKQPEKRKIQKIQKTIDSESAIRNINDTHKKRDQLLKS